MNNFFGKFWLFEVKRIGLLIASTCFIIKIILVQLSPKNLKSRLNAAMMKPPWSYGDVSRISHSDVPLSLTVNKAYLSMFDLTVKYCSLSTI